MSTRTNRAVVLKHYANGTLLEEANFALETRSLPKTGSNEVLLETLVLSPDPYMRGRMTGLDNFFLPQFGLGDPIVGTGIARVLESNDPSYRPGQLVQGLIEWADFSIWNGTGHLVGGGPLQAIDPQISPISRALHVLGTNGITAFFGVLDVAHPRRGETMLISGAAGSIGSLAGQIAKMQGCRVIGLAGSDEKLEVLTAKLGFDAALNYRSPALEHELLTLMPTGPDVYFDNVGGALSQKVMKQMQRPARVIECGQISTYEDAGGGWTVDIRPIHSQGLRFESFTPLHFLEFFPAALAQLSHWLKNNQLMPLETVLHGLENGPRALVGLFRGENIGKMLLEVLPY